MLTNLTFQTTADNYIGTNQESINSIAELFSVITNSGLSESQQLYLALKMLEILNSEIAISNSVIANHKTILANNVNIHGTVAASKVQAKIKMVKNYQSNIEVLQQLFANYFKKVFQDLYDSEILSPLEFEDAISHYIEQHPLSFLRNDRSSFCKKIRKVFRGFSGSVRGVKKCKK